MIDAHQHFWKFNAEEFGWLQGDYSALRRDFLPEDLAHAFAHTGVTGTISVQACPTVAETEWLLDQAGHHSFIKGVVGWAPLKDKSVGSILDRLQSRALFKGVREMLQGAPDSVYFTDDTFHRGMRELTRRGLSYDLLVQHDQLPAATAFVEQHPDQVFVLDHIGKPAIQKSFDTDWARDIRQLAGHANVFCKLSGMVTEIRGSGWNVDLLRPYFDIVLESFRPERLMFGSDWPICLVRTQYTRWMQIVGELVASLSAQEKQYIWARNARQVYRL